MVLKEVGKHNTTHFLLFVILQSIIIAVWILVQIFWHSNLTNGFDFQKQIVVLSLSHEAKQTDKKRNEKTKRFLI